MINKKSMKTKRFQDFQLNSNRKAQGMPLNIIIIAAICLIVLVILTVIFIGRMGKTREEIDRCQTNGGTCEPACTGEYSRETSSYKCYYSLGEDIPSDKKAGDSNPDLKCCIKV